MSVKAGIGENKITLSQILILVFSFVALGALVADLFLEVPKEAARLLNVLDTIICGVFLVDFSVRFYQAESKLRFMRWGWIDLLASIPNLEVLRWGRLVRVLQITRNRA